MWGRSVVCQLRHTQHLDTVSVSFVFERFFLSDMKDKGHISVCLEHRFTGTSSYGGEWSLFYVGRGRRTEGGKCYM